MIDEHHLILKSLSRVQLEIKSKMRNLRQNIVNKISLEIVSLRFEIFQTSNPLSVFDFENLLPGSPPSSDGVTCDIVTALSEVDRPSRESAAQILIINIYESRITHLNKNCARISVLRALHFPTPFYEVL